MPTTTTLHHTLTDLTNRTQHHPACTHIRHAHTIIVQNLPAQGPPNRSLTYHQTTKSAAQHAHTAAYLTRKIAAQHPSTVQQHANLIHAEAHLLTAATLLTTPPPNKSN